MAERIDTSANPIPSLLTKTEYTALVPTLKAAYDKIYGTGESRKHHHKNYTAAKRAENVDGLMEKRFELIKE